MAKQGSFQVNTQHIDNLTKQIENATDCTALTQIFEQHLDSVTDLVESKIETQLEILKNYLPLLSLPGPNPAAILKWLKKLLTGTIMPQLRAYINLLIQIAQLQQSIQQLISAITSAEDKIRRCVEGSIIEGTKFKLQQKINELTQPIDDALATVNSLETQIKAVIESPTDPFIVTTNLEGFLETAEEGFAKLGLEVEEFNDSEIEPSPTFSGNVAISNTTTLVIEGGLIVGADSANTG